MAVSCPACGEEISEFKINCPMCGHAMVELDDGMAVDRETIGAATKHRYFAAVGDNLLALIFSFLLAAQLSFLSRIQQGLSAYAFYLLYYLLFEAAFATTPAKMYFGLRIVQLETGEKVNLTGTVIRTLFRIVEANPLVGWLPAGLLILFTRRKQRLGDLVAGTVVIGR